MTGCDVDEKTVTERRLLCGGERRERDDFLFGLFFVID
jgi:hypothetical protein